MYIAFYLCAFLLHFLNTAKTVSVVSGVVSSLVIMLLLVIAIVIAVVCVKRNRHKEQSSDNRNVELDVHYNHPATSIKFSQETISSEVYRSRYGTPQQITSVKSGSETSIYDNVEIDDDPTSSEQQTNHPYVNVKYNVQPAGPNITVSQSHYYSRDTSRK